MPLGSSRKKSMEALLAPEILIQRRFETQSFVSIGSSPPGGIPRGSPGPRVDVVRRRRLVTMSLGHAGLASPSVSQSAGARREPPSTTAPIMMASASLSGPGASSPSSGGDTREAAAVDPVAFMSSPAYTALRKVRVCRHTVFSSG